jgi:hypothetical protein
MDSVDLKFDVVNGGTEALRGLVDFCNGHGITDVRAFGGTDMKMIILTGPVSSH